MAIKSDLRKLDHPIIFALSITLTVVGTMTVMSWFFNSAGFLGPLSVLKGGFVSPSGGTQQ
jgi:heme/copper-type cytochrome/quinol oxidase subunit 4